MKNRKHRFAKNGQQPHHRYGMVKIEYARFTPHALVIGWGCKYGFGTLTVRQNYTGVRNPEVSIFDPGAYAITYQPGVYIDAEAMGPEFAGEVMKALYWAQERGEVTPETLLSE